MLILIHKDSATKVPREVKDLEEAQAFRATTSQGRWKWRPSTTDSARWCRDYALKLSAFVTAACAAVEEHVTGVPAAEAKPKGIVAKVKAAVTRKKK
jgi:hypothetical protein